MTIQVVLVDNRRLVAIGLKELLQAEGDIEVLDIRTDCHTPCAQDCMQPPPDVLIMEPDLDGVCGLDCIHRIVAKNPQTHVLVLSHDANAITAQHALSLGALGFISKDATPDELLTAVRMVAAGKEYISQDIGRHLIRRRFQGKVNRFESLSTREHEVILLMLAGHSASEISKSLSISSKTLANHHTHIMHKLDVRNMVELTRLAIRHGVIIA